MVTKIVLKVAGGPTVGGRSWEPLAQTAPSAWGIFGIAFRREEFTTLAVKARGAV